MAPHASVRTTVRQERDVDHRTLTLFELIAREHREPERRRLRDEVVRLNLPLAHGLAAHYRRRGIEHEDLDQVACLGLVKAVRGFRLEVGRPFPAYARPTISGEIKRHFRDHGWMVRPPRHLQEAHARLRTTHTGLAQSLGRMPTVEEVAADAGVPEPDAVLADGLDSAYSCASLDAPCGEGSRCLADGLPDQEDPFELVEVHEVLRPALAELTDTERQILRLRFVDGLSQREIGERIGTSQMQVSRLLAGILGRLREQVMEDPGLRAG